jgi:hypothetical protein
VEPGIALARERHPELAAAACVPVRETEAWMLADEAVFGALKIEAQLPHDPEAELDPKATLKRLLASRPRRREEPYSFFGANVRTAALRRLSAFLSFEDELRTAILIAAGRSATV